MSATFEKVAQSMSEPLQSPSPMKIVVDMQPVEIKDQAGNVLIDAPLLDIFYLVGAVMGEASTTNVKDRFQAVANALNQEYGCQLTWSAALKIVRQVEDVVEGLKKTEDLLSDSSSTESSTNEKLPASTASVDGLGS